MVGGGQRLGRAESERSCKRLGEVAQLLCKLKNICLVHD